MAQPLKSVVFMRNVLIAAAALLAAACRGEPPPRDYQNNPPAMTHPADSKSQSPSQHGMPGPAPEPSRGAEGRTVQPVEPVNPATTTTNPPPSGTQNPEAGAPENTRTNT